MIRVSNVEHMISEFDPRTGAGRSLAHSRVTCEVSQSGLTSTRPRTPQYAYAGTVGRGVVGEICQERGRTCEDLGSEMDHVRNVVWKRRCILRKIIQYVLGLAHSHHQLLDDSVLLSMMK